MSCKWGSYFFNRGSVFDLGGLSREGWPVCMHALTPIADSANGAAGYGLESLRCALSVPSSWRCTSRGLSWWGTMQYALQQLQPHDARWAQPVGRAHQPNRGHNLGVGRCAHGQNDQLPQCTALEADSRSVRRRRSSSRTASSVTSVRGERALSRSFTRLPVSIALRRVA